MCKRFISVSCFVFVLVLVPTSTIKAQDEYLVGWWKFDDGSGTKAVDSSGNGYDGTLEGGATWATGKYDGAVLLDGTDSYVNLDIGPLIGHLTDCTIAIWVNWGGTSGGWSRIWDFGNSSTSGYMFLCPNQGTATGNMRWTITEVSNGAGEEQIVNSSEGVLPSGDWHHVTITIDTATTTATMYLDGEVVGENTNVTLTPSVMGNTTQNWLGRSQWPPDPYWDGLQDELRIYNSVLTVEEIVGIMSGLRSVKGVASGPQPGNGETDVRRDVILSWNPGKYPGTHNVYFGTDFDDVNDGIADVLMSENQSDTTYDPGFLELGTTYYWKIDEVNDSADATVYEGIVWNFTTEPIAYKIPSSSITATASSWESGDEVPENTINESGLDPDNMDFHSTKIEDMWATAEANMADPAWIQYDFDKIYKLYQMLVWNYNGESLLKGFGFKDVNIVYSEDGETWTQLTSMTQFQRASGLPGYEYNNTVDFNGMSVKSVRINALNNWGGPWYPQSGLSEVRFLYIPVRAREPYPDDVNDVPVDVTLTWREGREATQHVVSYSMDEQAVIDGTETSYNVTQTSYGPLSLDLGSVYYWRVDEVGDSDTWEGNLWSFRTQEYIIVEGFESYDDEEPNRVWDTWADGWDDDNNGSTMGYPDPDFDNREHFVETNTVHGGSQSGPVLYNNTAPVNYSEVTLTLDSAQNWTSNTADEVTMSFRGNAVEFYESDDGYIAMSAEGDDIYGTADEFRYAYKTLTGNGSITVRVDSIENANEWSKAGIMIRNSLDPDAMHVTTVLGANDIAELERRILKGGSTTTTDVANYGSPCWLRITRTGNNFTTECSKDGVNWRSFGADPNVASTATVEMGNTVYIGLVVTSHEPDVVAAATFYGAETTGNVTSDDWTVEIIGADDEYEVMNTIDKLYIALEDNSGHRHDVYAPVITAVGYGDWYEWIIPQSEFTSNGVNMTSIKKIIVGVGDPSDPMHGSGMIFIDDIGYGRSIEP